MKIVFKTCLVVILLMLTIISIILLNIWLGILEITESVTISPGITPIEPIDPQCTSLLTIVLPILMAIGILMRFIPQKKSAGDSKKNEK